MDNMRQTKKRIESRDTYAKMSEQCLEDITEKPWRTLLKYFAHR